MKRIILFLAILTLLTGCDYVVKPSLIEGESAKLYVLEKSLNNAGAEQLRQMFFDCVCSKDTRHMLDTTTLDGMMKYDGLRRIWEENHG